MALAVTSAAFFAMTLLSFLMCEGFFSSFGGRTGFLNMPVIETVCLGFFDTPAPLTAGSVFVLRDVSLRVRAIIERSEGDWWDGDDCG